MNNDFSWGYYFLVLLRWHMVIMDTFFPQDDYILDPHIGIHVAHRGDYMLDLHV